MAVKYECNLHRASTHTTERHEYSINGIWRWQWIINSLQLFNSGWNQYNRHVCYTIDWWTLMIIRCNYVLLFMHFLTGKNNCEPLWRSHNSPQPQKILILQFRESYNLLSSWKLHFLNFLGVVIKGVGNHSKRINPQTVCWAGSKRLICIVEYGFHFINMTIQNKIFLCSIYAVR